jgi:hypothetical protein
MHAIVVALDYRVIYDARDHILPNWMFAASGLVMVVAGLLMRWGALRGVRAGWKSVPGKGGGEYSMRDVRVFGNLFVAGGLLFALSAAGSMYVAQASLRRALKDGTYSQVEGVVASLQVDGRRDDEVWQIQTAARLVEYELSGSIITAGYRRTQRHGSPVRAGIGVRIADVDGRIARLEIVQ